MFATLRDFVCVSILIVGFHGPLSGFIISMHIHATVLSLTLAVYSPINQSIQECIFFLLVNMLFSGAPGTISGIAMAHL